MPFGHASEPHGAVAPQVKGSGKYTEVVYAADVSIPEEFCKRPGHTAHAKLHVSEGLLKAPLNYEAMK